MVLRYLTGEPLRIYKKIASEHGFYDKQIEKFVYALEGETRKLPDFNYNDLDIKEILNKAMEYYNSNSSSSVEIVCIDTYDDYFAMKVSSDYPLEGPSRSLAVFGKYISEQEKFKPFISGSSILRYNDLTYDKRKIVIAEFEKHQMTMSDYDFTLFFLSRLMSDGVTCTNEDRKFIEKIKSELYKYMLSPLEYIYNK